MVFLLEVFWWVFLGGQEINNFVLLFFLGLLQLWLLLASARWFVLLLQRARSMMR